MSLPGQSWRIDAATAYIATLRERGLFLELLAGDRLRIPPGHSPAELELVRLLKPELVRLVRGTLSPGLPWEDAQALREERAAILEYEAGMSREEAERRAGLAGFGAVEGAQNGAQMRNIA